MSNYHKPFLWDYIVQYTKDVVDSVVNHDSPKSRQLQPLELDFSDQLKEIFDSKDNDCLDEYCDWCSDEYFLSDIN